jgi:hypothetical protein
MTANPPDPDPARTPGLEPGGGVPPGETPPESGQVSGVSHHEDPPPRGAPTVTIVLVLVVAVLVALLVAAQVFGLLHVR